MPNWCECLLKVTGPAKEVALFKKKGKGRGPKATKKEPMMELSLHSLVPLPSRKKKDPEDYWYQWSISNWGTKWDLSEPRIVSEARTSKGSREKVTTVLEYGFETAWAPPMAWLKTVGPMFPKLSFRLWYCEEGAYFAGIYTVEGDDGSNEEKDCIDAQIEERGSYNVQCGYCDDEMEITSKDAVRICEDCLKFRCDNCGKQDDVHIDGKCPFDSTKFKNISAEKIK